MLLDDLEMVERLGRGNGHRVPRLEPAVGQERATRKIPALSRARHQSDGPRSLASMSKDTSNTPLTCPPGAFSSSILASAPGPLGSTD